MNGGFPLLCLIAGGPKHDYHVMTVSTRIAELLPAIELRWSWPLYPIEGPQLCMPIPYMVIKRGWKIPELNGDVSKPIVNMFW